MKFSVIVTVHDEGEMAKATMQSVLRATGWVKDFEILVVIDRGTAATKQFFQTYKGNAWVRVVECNYGDVGPARNFGVAEARGSYVFFVDGDDLISRGYIEETLAILERATEEIVVCPEFCIGFSEDGRSGSVFRMADSQTRAEDAFLLFNINLWTVAIAGRKEIFLKHRYIRSVDGYGHEDYAMNIELTEAGIQHVVAPGTVYFHREKRQSRQTWNDARRATEPYSKLFRPKFWRDEVSQAVQMNDSEELNALARLKQLYLKIGENGALKWAAEKARGMISWRLMKELPTSIRQEWRAIGELEPVAAPKKKMNAMGMRGANRYCPASRAYLRICQECTHGDEFDEIDLARYAAKIPAEQQDILISRLAVQSHGKVRFTDKTVLTKWRKYHPDLADALGMSENSDH